MTLDASVANAGEAKVAALVEKVNVEKARAITAADLAYASLPPAVQDAFVQRAQTDEATIPPDTHTHLFDVLSTFMGNYSHVARFPMCQECVPTALTAMDAALAEAEHKRDTLDALKTELLQLSLIKNEEPCSEDILRWQRQQDRVMRDIKTMQGECDDARAGLQHAHDEKQRLQAILDNLEKEGVELSEEEDALWYTLNDRAAELDLCTSQNASIETELAKERQVMKLLSETSAYRDAFSIDKDSYGIGTINGLRLGRFSASRSQDQVAWSEINVAWGQLALLLTMLQHKLHYDNPTYKVVARGAQSVVERLEPEHAVYELYATSEWQLGRILHSRRFDWAMIGFLTCVHGLYMHAKTTIDPTLTMPYTYVISLLWYSNLPTAYKTTASEVLASAFNLASLQCGLAQLGIF